MTYVWLGAQILVGVVIMLAVVFGGFWLWNWASQKRWDRQQAQRAADRLEQQEKARASREAAQARAVPAPEPAWGSGSPLHDDTVIRPTVARPIPPRPETVEVSLVPMDDDYLLDPQRRRIAALRAAREALGGQQAVIDPQDLYAFAAFILDGPAEEPALRSTSQRRTA